MYGTHEHPQNEHTTPLNSGMPYAVVKNVGEAFLRSYKRSLTWITPFFDSSILTAPSKVLILMSSLFLP